MSVRHRSPIPDGATLPTIRDVLSRVHFRVTLFAVGMAAITVLLSGIVVMRAYAYHNLELIAQTASYTVEAAVVFDDPTAAAEGIAPLRSTEGLAALRVETASGRPLATWQRTGEGAAFAARRAIGQILFARAVTAPIRHEGRMIGRIVVNGDPGGLVRFVLTGLMGMLACLAVTAVATGLLARRLRQSVVAPLRAIAEVAHAVRNERALDRRAPPARIAEIDALGQDINALLAELEGWHNSLRFENQLLEHRASHDPLTGLRNRAAFDRCLADALAGAAKRGESIALLYLDSNRFKETNDRHGHAAGDAVLIEIARRIESLLGPGDVAARLGGDEFAILLAAPAVPEQAERIAVGLTRLMEAPVVVPAGGSLVTSLSVGLALFPRDAADPEALVRAADAAMYAAKRLHHL